jgi:DNA-binding MarR family transcriptional regulator
MAVSGVDVRGFRKDVRRLEREVVLSLAADTGCCGVTQAQCHIIMEADGQARTSVTDLAAAMELDKSTLSRTVDGMCRAGWLSRETDPANRRQQIICLSRKGRAKAETIHAQCDASTLRLFDFVPARKRRQVVESVALLASAMRQMRKESGSACCVEQAE